MAERMSGAEFSELMNRFYRVATDVLIKTDAFIDKLIGDEVMAVFLPIFAGKQHAQLAIQAAEELLRATGHDDSGGPWLPVGVGVHSGPTYFCAVTGAEGSLADFTALGDNVNIAARLASTAGAGEALITDAACAAAGLDPAGYERRLLKPKGKSEMVGVRVLRVAPG